MVDFTMCQSRLCRLADTCRRHPDSGTKPGARQSYLTIDREIDLRNGCELYWHTEQQEIEKPDPWDIEPDEPGDGRIVRKQIEDDLWNS
jgi:hypothetical protein